ncbi:hypothetical protein SAMD00019534_035930 [Acytostelium subglobosum LB1]|uniref:hypothetical protein n=1 Tax=Acytostelium subglobosum LB1 TaxID=1410327 RepID=UPI000644A5D7|nr:hypothetical protein SAMD00019534_035930 [Acytostelium subglobosum LB1]GAM20418.1 hypothetical protein SAMD00019534_035930 [Acytostelium subglobosum LB1]|eukprot:XP_012759939.1 hypothetical protein SAMD00019534_035930 [Acytostelium subglobosum LB1]
MTVLSQQLYNKILHLLWRSKAGPPFNGRPNSQSKAQRWLLSLNLVSSTFHECILSLNDSFVIHTHHIVDDMAPHLVSAYAPFPMPLRRLVLNYSPDRSSEKNNIPALLALVDGLAECTCYIDHAPIVCKMLPSTLRYLNVTVDREREAEEYPNEDYLKVLQTIASHHHALEHLVINLEVDYHSDRYRSENDDWTGSNNIVGDNFFEFCNHLFGAASFASLTTFKLKSCGDDLQLSQNMMNYPGYFFSRLHHAAPNLESLTLSLATESQSNLKALLNGLVWFMQQTPTLVKIMLLRLDSSLNQPNLITYLLQTSNVKQFNIPILIGSLIEIKRHFRYLSLTLDSAKPDLDDVRTINALQSLRLVDHIKLIGLGLDNLDLTRTVLSYIGPPTRALTLSGYLLIQDIVSLLRECRLNEIHLDLGIQEVEYIQPLQQQFPEKILCVRRRWSKRPDREWMSLAK